MPWMQQARLECSYKADVLLAFNPNHDHPILPNERMIGDVSEENTASSQFMIYLS